MPPTGTSSKTAHLRFKKRKECIMKKARELSVLCDVKVCALVTDPDDGTIETWPENRLEVEEILKDHVFKKTKVGKIVKDNKQPTSIVGDESLLKLVEEKLESVKRRIELLKNMNNDQNQSFFVQNFHGNSATQSSLSMNSNSQDQSFFVPNFHGNSAIQSSQSVSCNTEAWAAVGGDWVTPPVVQPMQSGFSGELEPMPLSGSSQFSQPLQSVEPGLLGEFREFQELLQSMTNNTIIGDSWIAYPELDEVLNINTSKEFPYFQPQEFQMEDYWGGQSFQDYTTDDEVWGTLEGLDSILKTLDCTMVSAEL